MCVIRFDMKVFRGIVIDNNRSNELYVYDQARLLF